MSEHRKLSDAVCVQWLTLLAFPHFIIVFFSLSLSLCYQTNIKTYLFVSTNIINNACHKSFISHPNFVSLINLMNGFSIVFIQPIDPADAMITVNWPSETSQLYFHLRYFSSISSICSIYRNKIWKIYHIFRTTVVNLFPVWPSHAYEYSIEFINHHHFTKLKSFNRLIDQS